MSETSYLFVDGAYLRMVLQTLSNTYFQGRAIEISPWSLFAGFRKGFYYDCLPVKTSGETEEQFQHRVEYQQKFFRQLRDRQGVHVVEGVIKGSRNRRQKKIDVSITVDMLTHSYHRNMDKVTLFAGDLDFMPLIEALVRDGMYVTIWYEESSASEELVYAADERRILNIGNIFNLMTSECRQIFSSPNEGTRSRTNYSITPIKQGISSKGNELTLYETDGQFEIINLPLDASDVEGFISHPDREFLEKYADFHYGKVIWRS